MMMKNIMHILFLSAMACACTTQNNTDRLSGDTKRIVSVSLPVEAYFVDQLTCGTVDANILIPQSAGHSDYSPLPSQMMELSHSDAYLAIGALDFELTWRDRMQSANSNMKWIDLSEGITLIAETEEETEEDHGHHHHQDPHYWLSPKRAITMVGNMAKILKEYTRVNVDSAAQATIANLQKLDTLFANIENKNGKAFMIYHPALTYLAADYGFVQLEIEKDGNAPSPQSYMQQIEKAKAAKVKTVFVQTGFDVQKAKSAANMVGAKVVDFNPESIEYMATMGLIYEALKE